jgi:hypothetical protein
MPEQKIQEFYRLVYYNKEEDCYVVHVVMAEDYFAAERVGKEDVKKWKGYKFSSVNHMNKRKLLSGAPVSVADS